MNRITSRGKFFEEKLAGACILELHVSVITVKKAWEELERSGLINMVTGKGCFVAEFSRGEMLRIRNEMVLKQMESDTSYYKSFGLTLDEVIGLLNKIY